MTKLQKALYTHWISRLGRAKVNELADGMDVGKSVFEKSREIVNSTSEANLKSLVLEGFTGFFHQTAYLRRTNAGVVNNNIDAVKKITEEGAVSHSTVLVKLVVEGHASLRALLTVTEAMEFLPLGQGAPVSFDIPFPVCVNIAGQNISVHTLTMQSTMETWAEIVSANLRRMLSVVRADSHYDHAVDFLRAAGVDVGDYVDCSSEAIKLMKRAGVHTYSGTLEVGTVGSSKHSALRGKGKKPLRESMADEFSKLVSAKRVVTAEVEIAEDHLGIKAGSKLALYPSIGKIAFRSNLEGCNPDEFVLAMAKI